MFANDTKPGRYFEDQPDVNDDFQIHLMYLLAKDSEDRGWDINGKISDIITKMNDQMFRATSANSKSGGIGKKYKLDYRKDGKLDITFIRLDKNEAELLSGISISDRYSATCAAEKLLMFGVANVAITLGSQGVLLANGEKKQFLEATSVSAVDTTAAGDCFSGAVAAKLSHGFPLAEAIRSGILASTICVTRHGAQEAMPYMNEVNSL